MKTLSAIMTAILFALVISGMAAAKSMNSELGDMKSSEQVEAKSDCMDKKEEDKMMRSKKQWEQGAE